MESVLQSLGVALSYVLLGVAVLVFVYAAARLCSSAHFRAKLDYFREARKELNKEEDFNNGKG